MRKITIPLNIFIIPILVLIVSCEQARDIDPVDSIGVDQAFQSVSDLQEALNSVYLSYRPERVMAFSSIFTDSNRLGSGNSDFLFSDVFQQLTVNSFSVEDIWINRYRTISDINTLLPFTQILEPNSFLEVEQLNNIVGQSLALRALAHLDLMLLYTAGSTVNDFDVFAPNNLAVPYITEVDISNEPIRNTVAEVAEAITADLDMSSSFLGEPSDINFVTQAFITAVRSRLALYIGDNTGAITYSTELINQFPLANQTQYFNMFRDDTDTTEIIWNLLRTEVDGINPGAAFAFSNSFQPIFEVSNQLANLIDDNDVRKSVIIDLVGSEFNETRVGKYLGRPGENLRNNFKVFRVSEQYLIRAEARAKMGQFVAAAHDIDALVDARFGLDMPLPTFTNLNNAIDEILLQRRLELAFEGQRYMDLRRTKAITGNGIMRDPTLLLNGLPGTEDCGTRGVPCTLAPNDRRFTLPIPQDEINGNSAITQNPGY